MIEVVNPRPAATVIILRDGLRGLEVFMIKRSGKVGFMPHAHVFPGGRVDEEDYQLKIDDEEGLIKRLESDDASAYVVAAVREAFEEAGILLAEGSLPDGSWESLNQGEVSFQSLYQRHSLRIKGLDLGYWAWWITPRGERRRYDTRFFVAGVASSVVGSHDGREAVNSGWYKPADALRLFEEEGEIFLAPPTYRTLQELLEFTSVDEVMLASRRRTVLPIEPLLGKEDDGALAIVLPGDPDHPADFSVEGAKRLVLRNGRWWTRR